MNIDFLLNTIKDAAFEVRKHLDPGFLESVYQNALIYELRERGLNAVREFPITVYYKETVVGEFRADIVVENAVIIEVKAVSTLNSVHETQLVNYLVATGIDYGYLINYGGEKYRIIKKTRIYNP